MLIRLARVANKVCSSNFSDCRTCGSFPFNLQYHVELNFKYILKLSDYVGEALSKTLPSISPYNTFYKNKSTWFDYLIDVIYLVWRVPIQSLSPRSEKMRHAVPLYNIIFVSLSNVFSVLFISGSSLSFINWEYYWTMKDAQICVGSSDASNYHCR